MDGSARNCFTGCGYCRLTCRRCGSVRDEILPAARHFCRRYLPLMATEPRKVSAGRRRSARPLSLAGQRPRASTRPRTCAARRALRHRDSSRRSSEPSSSTKSTCVTTTPAVAPPTLERSRAAIHRPDAASHTRESDTRGRHSRHQPEGAMGKAEAIRVGVAVANATLRVVFAPTARPVRTARDTDRRMCLLSLLVGDRTAPRCRLARRTALRPPPQAVTMPVRSARSFTRSSTRGDARSPPHSPI